MAFRHWAGLSSGSPTRRSRVRRGFSLVEAMVAITVLALAGSVLLLAVDTSLQTTTEAVDRSIADGLAQQLLDEISLQHFMEPGTACTDPLGPSGWENSGKGRERYNDTDDFHNFAAHPAEGLWGEPLGTGNGDGNARHSAFQVPTNYFNSWRQRVEVYFVDPSDPSERLTSGSSEYRGIEVTIERIEPDGTVRPLASRKKVIAYVPPPTY
jgi:prepilin-type N-terminal cleavage/methylation domain-containing protein